MNERELKKDAEYYAARDGLFKLANHPGVGPDVSSRIIKHLRDRRTEEMLTWLKEQPEIKKLEKPQKVDVGLNPEELKAISGILPQIQEIVSVEELSALKVVGKEQKKVILERPPTFGQKLRNWPGSQGFKKTIFWGGLGINTMPGAVGTIVRIIGISELGLQLQIAQVYVYIGEGSIVVGSLALLLGTLVLSNIYSDFVGSGQTEKKSR